MYNEDRYSAGVLDVNGSKIFNFNIFDGHGGGQCSDFLTDNLSQHVENANGLAAVDEAGDKPREKLIKTDGCATASKTLLEWPNLESN